MSVLDDILAEQDATAWPEQLPDHLSASSLSLLERCPEMFRRRYILGERERPSSALLWGTADGKAHAVNFTQKIETGVDLPEADVTEAFAAIFDSEIEGVGGNGEIDWRDDAPGSVKDRGAALVGAYHRQVSPRVQPTGVEVRFEIDVPTVAVPFIGYVDVETEPYSIERKTSTAKAAAIPPQYRLQTLGYALARRKPVELHIATRTKLPAVWTPLEEPGLLQSFDVALPSRAERLIAARARQLVGLWEMFGPDEPWPDAIGTQAWHMAVCDMCGWGPNGSATCEWWRN